MVRNEGHSFPVVNFTVWRLSEPTWRLFILTPYSQASGTPSGKQRLSERNRDELFSFGWFVDPDNGFVPTDVHAKSRIDMKMSAWLD